MQLNKSIEKLKIETDILKTTLLNIGYTSKSIASAIDMNVDKGDMVAIVGVNGIGKSTLLRTLAGFQKPISGSITINSTALTGYSSQKLATIISVVLTEPIASKNMTVLELVTLGRQPYTNWIGSLTTKDIMLIENTIALFDLMELQHMKCFELSDGQFQRALIARAFAQDTAIILLDEPTTHLDLHHKVRILKLLKNISKKTDKTIIYTTHEIEMALQLSDKLVVLNGTDNPYGTPDTLVQRGVFNKLFPSDVLTFDNNSRTFQIND